MESPAIPARIGPTPRHAAKTISPALLACGLLFVGACASSPNATPQNMEPAQTMSMGATVPSELSMSTAAPSPDPRVGLKAGVFDAGTAFWNMRLVSTTPSPEPLLGQKNSDLAFSGNFVYQGNYNGFASWDISNPSRPVMTKAFHCPASQSDVSVFNHLLFVSAESGSARTDCSPEAPAGTVNPLRLRGIRVLDITNPGEPWYLHNVQTCRGSHTHTVASDPRDPDNVYIYISGTAGVRSAEELPGCLDAPIDDPNSSRFRVEIIQVPLNNPTQARMVTSARIFNDLSPAPRRGGGAGGRGGRGGGRGAAAADSGAAGSGAAAVVTPPPAGRGAGAPAGGRGGSGPNQCHDITVYPAAGLAGGACAGLGLLLDISDIRNPIRIDAVADSNMSFWHSATFSNDGTKVLFSDEWGGGTAPNCKATDDPKYGANAIFTIENGKMVFQSYYKLPAPQTQWENCVAHNGSLIPVPGREVMVQAWYQGGISIFDWTDPARPFEVAYFDRGPLRDGALTSAGPWSVYWYNGLIISSEIARGLDILELTPSAHITQNEIDAAKTVVWRQLNPQEQPRIVWPASFAKARAFVDQLTRSNGLPSTRLLAIRNQLAHAESLTGAQRSAALTTLSTQLVGEQNSSSDAAKVRMLALAVTELATTR